MSSDRYYVCWILQSFAGLQAFSLMSVKDSHYKGRSLHLETTQGKWVCKNQRTTLALEDKTISVCVKTFQTPTHIFVLGKTWSYLEQRKLNAEPSSCILVHTVWTDRALGTDSSPGTMLPSRSLQSFLTAIMRLQLQMSNAAWVGYVGCLCCLQDWAGMLHKGTQT